MKRILERYGIHFAAVIGVVVVGVLGAGYILANQRFYPPSWVPVIGSDFVDYTIDFASAKSVVPGQGQTVTISGVTVGEIGSVKLVQGRGRVTVKIQHKYANRIHTNASAALRPRTPLEDMILQLNPGTPGTPLLPHGGNIPAERTMTPTEFDELLAEFDPDTRSYLAILLQQGAKGLQGQGGKEFGRLLRNFEPTAVYSRRIARALKSRNAQAARAVTSLKTVSDALGKNSEALGTFISAGSETFQAFSDSREQLAGVVQNSPAALKSATQLLNSAGSISADLGPAARKLDRPTVKLDAGLANLVTFMNAATPVIKNDLRPFATETQAPLAALKPAVDNLASSGTDVSTGAQVLRQLFDGFAYKPKGEDLSALTLAGFIGHAGMSLTSNQDAAGAVARTILYSSCALTTTGVPIVRNITPSARTAVETLGTPLPETKLPNGQTVSEYCRATGQ